MNADPSDIKSLREFIKNELGGSYPEREIESMTWILFEDIAGIPRSELNLDPFRVIDPGLVQQVAEAVDQLKGHRPVQYILGSAEFFGLRFRVTPDVLIPRPETEELVQWVVDDHPGFQGSIMDIGTGSGCIAVSLKKTLPEATVYATDVSEEALGVAIENAEINEVKVRFLLHDISMPYMGHALGKLDILVSNPPYIPLSERDKMDLNVTSHEPAEALFVPDDDVLQFYSWIAEAGQKFLIENGSLYLEIHEKFGKEVVELLSGAGYHNITLRKDINGKDRMINCTFRHPELDSGSITFL